MPAVAILGFGTVLLLIGAELLIHGSKLLAYKLRVSQLFISMTVVALGTSLPELTVSSISVFRQDVGLATGNIVGSSVMNATFILGLAILARPLRIGTSKTQKNTTILLYITILFIILYLSTFSRLTSAGLLLGMAIISFLIEYIHAVYGRQHEDKKHIAHYPVKLPGWNRVLIFVAIGLGGLVFGGSLLVASVTEIAIEHGISTTFLGLTLTALLTTMPELITTVLAQLGNDGKIALGNILGSNIYNLALIGGIISLSGVKGTVRPEEFIFLFGSSAAIWFIARRYQGQNVPRAWGVGLVLFYLLYLYATSYSYLVFPEIPILP